MFRRYLSGFLAAVLVLVLIAPTQSHALTMTVIITMYKNAKETGGKAPLGHSKETKKSSLPVSGETGYTSKDLVKDGKVVQRRYYNGDGKVDMDIDYTDHGNPKQHPKVPHRHDWHWPPSGPPSRGDWY